MSGAAGDETVESDGTVIEAHVSRLESGTEKRVTIGKELLPELPRRFEESYPANAMWRVGSVASYRSTRKGETVHIIEFEDHWELHLDDFNPIHDPWKHLLYDTRREVAVLGLALLSLGIKFVRD